jgi:hypothetical protein
MTAIEACIVRICQHLTLLPSGQKGKPLAAYASKTMTSGVKSDGRFNNEAFFRGFI